MQTRLLIAMTALASIAAAQSIVLPNGFAAAEGNTSSAYPFGRANSAARVQYFYDSAAFVAGGAGAPMLINSIDWRANGAAVTAGGTHAGVGVTVKIGLCATDHLGVVSTFASNFAGTPTTFVANPVVVATGAGTTPNNYTATVTIPGGFFYDPNAGQDLAIEVSFPAGTFSTAATTAAAMDLHSAVGCGASRVFTTTDTAATGTVQTNLGAVVNFNYSPVVGAATVTSYGEGCLRCSDSFYENFATAAAFDLANTQTYTMVPTGSGYTITPGTGAFVPPSATATALALTDDSEALVTLSSPFTFPGGSTTTLAVCSNGYVSVATGNGTGFNPVAATMLAAPQTGWWSWHDYNPTLVGSGAVKFEEVGNVAYVTWDGVWDFGGTAATNANTFQFQFDKGTGTVSLVYGAMSGLGIGHLVGFSGGGASSDPGSVDISAGGLPATLCVPEIQPLTLAAGARPVIGTNVALNSSNVPGGSPFGAVLIGLTPIPAGLSLGFLGMPGCFQYNDNLASNLIFPVLGTSVAANISLLNPVVNYPGVSIQVQSFFFTGAPLGVSSNGLNLTLGTL